MKEKRGEHPFGDAGQFILLGLFLVVWIGDSFFLKNLADSIHAKTVSVEILGGSFSGN